MDNALLISVSFYQGRYHGRDDWPPAPARLFQALTAAVAEGSKIPEADAEALRWLEELPPPVIIAPEAVRGQRFTNFVPNNDTDSQLAKGSVLDIETAMQKARVGKDVQPWLFDENIPFTYCWYFGDGSKHSERVCVASDRLYRFGWGIDMAWARAQLTSRSEADALLGGLAGIVYRPGGSRGQFLRLECPRPGTFESLRHRFVGLQGRFRQDPSSNRQKLIFAQPPAKRIEVVDYSAKPHELIFELRQSGPLQEFFDWPTARVSDLTAFVRDNIAESLSRELPEAREMVERYVVGRDADDNDKSARMQIIPIPSVGHTFADMQVRRIAFLVPQRCPLDVADLEWAIGNVSWVGKGGAEWRLHRADDTGMYSRYSRSSRTWQSVTPLALPRAERRRIDPAAKSAQAKTGNERLHEEATAVASVCRALGHCGLHVVPTNVRLQREPLQQKGERAERFAEGTRFNKHAMWHVSFDLPRRVSGPLVLGDGRYVGLGIMLPVTESSGTVCLEGVFGLESNLDPLTVASAARRALMSRAQRKLGRNGQLPLYITGHEPSGLPAARGTHQHIAIVADIKRHRILFLAPHLFQPRISMDDWSQFRREHGLVQRALDGMDLLTVGTEYRIRLSAGTVNAEADPLFASSRIWVSETPYRVTRHRRRVSPEEALREDVMTELSRFGWPAVSRKDIEVLEVREGRRGGLTGLLRIRFATAQQGPMLLGRSLHLGGGLFVGE